MVMYSGEGACMRVRDDSECVRAENRVVRATGRWLGAPATDGARRRAEEAHHIHLDP